MRAENNEQTPTGGDEAGNEREIERRRLITKWSSKYELRTRGSWYPRWGGNLMEFIRRMVEEEGFEITSFKGIYGEQLQWMDATDYDELAYQALNHEDAGNITFTKGENEVTIAVGLSGDAWCDVIPIYDWYYSIGQSNPVDKIITQMREELMGEDA